MAITSGTKELIRKFAIKNAMDYGSAREGTIISKLLSTDPDLKSDMKALSAAVRDAVAEVNVLSRPELEREYSMHAKEFEAAEAEKAERSAKHAFSIPGAEKGKFVTRFPPEPGGYIHVGHAKMIFIEDELRRLYDGKMMLYFDDTNPDNARQEYVDAIREDLGWLGVRTDGEYYASDNIAMLYDYAAVAIGKGKAYVCTCDGERVRKLRSEGRGCEHKKQTGEENQELWKRMLGGGFKDNEAILRFNSDMEALNTTMRDPTLFRIKRARHYRQGERYSVWPTYDFCTPIIDSAKGITDALRDKNYEMRDELYFAVLDALGLRKPRITSASRLEIANNVTSKRTVRKMIADGQVTGWDDPRLVTVRALRRRGIVPEAMRQFALSFGMGKSESVVRIEMLLGINRRIVEPTARRLTFIEEPRALRVSGIDEKALRELENVDSRYKSGGDLFINATDAKGMKIGDIVRLNGAFDIRIDGVGKGFEAAYMGGEHRGAPRIQWITKEGAVRCELLTINELMKGEELNKDSETKTDGYADASASSLKRGDAVLFDKRGLFTLDSKERMSFISI